MNTYEPLTRAELAEKYPRTPTPIDRERFMEMLECLPPDNWNMGRIESFQLCELAYDNITLTCVWDHTRNEGWQFYTEHGATPAQIRAQLPRQLKCSVCAEDAGRWVQFHNQDTGWGICRKCVDWIKSPARAKHYEGDEAFNRCYGLPGVNYAPPPV